MAAEAATLAASIANMGERVRTQAEVASIMAVAGKPHHAAVILDQAESVARQIPHPYAQARALADVALALACSGRYREAEALGRSIIAAYRVDPDEHCRALAGIARALAQAGNHPQAEALARSITNPPYRATALADVATALAQAGQTRLAIRVTAALCAAGRWPTAMTPVLLLAQQPTI
jgi:hypothetical protein